MGWEGSRSPPNTTYIRGRGGVLGDPAAEGRRRKGGGGGSGGGHSPSHRRDEEEGQTKKGPRPTHSRHHIFSPTRHHARRRQAKKSVFCVVSPRPRHAPGRLKLKAFPFATPPSTPWDSDSGVRCSPQPLLLARFPTCPPCWWIPHAYLEVRRNFSNNFSKRMVAGQMERSSRRRGVTRVHKGLDDIQDEAHDHLDRP